jgi:uncharacterized membrane protein SirB2
LDYVVLKSIHVASVAASYGLFFLRGIWMIRAPAMLQRAWVGFVPHIVDTVLLGSAIALAFATGQYPFANSWLTAKVTGLFVYIGLGTIALKRGKTRGIRIAAWIAAQAVFGYIVAVALTRRPLLVAG